MYTLYYAKGTKMLGPFSEEHEGSELEPRSRTLEANPIPIKNIRIRNTNIL